jgi:hypothetical protein
MHLHMVKGASGVWGECLSHAKPRRTRRGLNSVVKESSSSKGEEKPSQAFSFAFFAASRLRGFA